MDVKRVKLLRRVITLDKTDLLNAAISYLSDDMDHIVDGSKCDYELTDKGLVITEEFNHVTVK